MHNYRGAAILVLLAFTLGGCKRQHAKVAQTTVQVSSAAAANVALQSEIIRADRTIEAVAIKLDLMKKWMVSDEDAIKRVKNATKVEGVQGTSLLQIRVFDADAQLAADIANALAESYQDRMAAAEKQRADEAIAKLEEELAAQEEKVTDLKASGAPAETIATEEGVLNDLTAGLAKQKADLAAPKLPVIIHEHAMP